MDLSKVKINQYEQHLNAVITHDGASTDNTFNFNHAMSVKLLNISNIRFALQANTDIL
jgi:hypothetical protein